MGPKFRVFELLLNPFLLKIPEILLVEMSINNGLPYHLQLRMEIDQLNMSIKVFQVRKYQMGMKLVNIGRFLVMQTLANIALMVLKYLLVSLAHFQKNQVLVFVEKHQVSKLLGECRDEQFHCCEDIQLLPKPKKYFHRNHTLESSLT